MGRKFSIKLDMTNIFKDERKYTIMMVDPQWPTVKSLRQRIREIYDVAGVIFVTNEGYYVPLEEPIEIIKDCEYLRVIKQEKASNGLPPAKFSVPDEESNALVEINPAATKCREEKNVTQMICHVPANVIDEDTSPILDNNGPLVFRCNLDDISNQPRIFKPNENCISTVPTSSSYTLTNYLAGNNVSINRNSSTGGNQGQKLPSNASLSNNSTQPINSLSTNNQYFM